MQHSNPGLWMTTKILLSRLTGFATAARTTPLGSRSTYLLKRAHSKLQIGIGSEACHSNSKMQTHFWKQLWRKKHLGWQQLPHYNFYKSKWEKARLIKQCSLDLRVNSPRGRIANEGERNNCLRKIYSVGQKNIETNHLNLLKLDFNPFLPKKHYKYGGRFLLLVGYNKEPNLVVAQTMRTQHIRPPVKFYV